VGGSCAILVATVQLAAQLGLWEWITWTRDQAEKGIVMVDTVSSWKNWTSTQMSLIYDTVNEDSSYFWTMIFLLFAYGYHTWTSEEEDLLPAARHGHRGHRRRRSLFRRIKNAIWSDSEGDSGIDPNLFDGGGQAAPDTDGETESLRREISNLKDEIHAVRASRDPVLQAGVSRLRERLQAQRDGVEADRSPRMSSPSSTRTGPPTSTSTA
jgi:hypothetical protein